MIFIGGGSLLTQAVSYSLTLGLRVDAVCVPVGDPSIPRLKKNNVFILQSNNPTTEVVKILDRLSDKIVFSVNNQFILGDSLLTLGPNYYNIHNGLVQNYRGIGEVCIFAAICNGETKYGATLHQIQQGQKVDSGRVIDQIQFSIKPKDDFYVVMKNSLEACQKIFEINIQRIVDNKYFSNYVELFNTAYSYKDIGRICAASEPGRLIRASSFRDFKVYFPKLVLAVDAARFNQ